MALGDVYQIVQEYVWNTAVRCSNVYYYRQTSTGLGTAEKLNNGFGPAVTAKLIALAPPFIEFYEQTVVNIKTPTDYFAGNYSGAPGTRAAASQPLPSFNALQYVSDRAAPGTRRARKRYPFLTEGDVSGNNVNSAELASDVFLEAGYALGQVITNSGESFEPVVVKRPVILGVLPVVSYRIPALSWQASFKVSTQNTRKQ